MAAQLRPGDALLRQKTGNPLIQHWGLFVGGGMVVDNQPSGVRRVTLEEFAAGYSLRVRPYAGSAPRTDVVACALVAVGTVQYQLLGNNCEAFVNHCQEGIRRSQQVDRAVAIGVGGLGAWLLYHLFTDPKAEEPDDHEDYSYYEDDDA